MIKTLTKHGNSQALIFDRTLTQLLRIDETTPLELRVEGDRLVITPLRQVDRETQIERLLERTNRKYGRALKKMAE